MGQRVGMVAGSRRRWIAVIAVVCVGVAVIAGASARTGGLPQQSGVVDLLSQANVRINGAGANDLAGCSVAAAGDVNGDGIADVIVGACGAGNNGRLGSGSAYVIFGRSSPGTVNLADLGSGGFRIDGAAAGDEAGYSVAGVGDVNGDGLSDVIVGAPYASNNARLQSGSAYVVFGKRSTAAVDLASLGSGGFRIDGAGAGDNTGYSVAGAGDFNGDGRPDVIVGAPSADNNGFSGSGAAYVVYGKASTGTIDLADYSAFKAGEGLRIDGGAVSDAAGYSVAGAGDVNGDGRPDVIVGAPGQSEAYVVFGIAFSGTIDLGTLGNLGFAIDGPPFTGSAVAGAGDVNGDGRPDVIVGSYQANTGRPYGGAAYVVYGKASTDTVQLAPPASLFTEGFEIEGAAAGDLVGYLSVAGAGDVNGDGRPDVIVDAHGAGNNARTKSGSAYVVYGKATTDTFDLGAILGGGFRIDGAAANDSAGYSVAGAGDFNGDGRPDVIVGADSAGSNGNPRSGAAYIVYGYGTPQLAYAPLAATAGLKISPHAPKQLKRTGEPSFTVSPALPAGLSLDAQTGVVSGTPTAPQPKTAYTVTMTDLVGQATATLSIEVKAPASPPPPPPPPPLAKPKLKASKLTIGEARAGKAFTVSMTIKNAATGKGVKGQIICAGKLADKSLPTAHRSSTPRGKASCTWQLPKTAHGKHFTGTIAERYKGAKVSRSFSAKVV